MGLNKANYIMYNILLLIMVYSTSTPACEMYLIHRHSPLTNSVPEKKETPLGRTA